MGYCIPLSDVVVADVHDDHLLFLTTQKQGFFEFSFDSKNAFDLMTAFLGAWLPEERITRMKNESTSATTFLDPICSFDVEAFTNTRIQEKVKHETLSEKMRRKVVHIAFQMGEMSSAISECACNSCGVTNSNSPADAERRQSPPRYVSSDKEAALSENSPPCKNSSLAPQLEPELESTTSSISRKDSWK
jgi:hypothetical protein